MQDIGRPFYLGSRKPMRPLGVILDRRMLAVGTLVLTLRSRTYKQELHAQNHKSGRWFGNITVANALVCSASSAIDSIAIGTYSERHSALCRLLIEEQVEDTTTDNAHNSWELSNSNIGI